MNMNSSSNNNNNNEQRNYNNEYVNQENVARRGRQFVPRNNVGPTLARRYPNYPSYDSYSNGAGELRRFPTYISRDNDSFMRLLHRIRTMRNNQRSQFSTPTIRQVINHYPVYSQFDPLTFQIAYNAVSNHFNRGK